MNSKKLTALLTSVSLSALSIAAIGRASAATVVVPGPNAAYTVPADTTFVDVNSSDISTFTNDKNISDGYRGGHSVGVFVDTDTIIDSFINTVAGNITAIEGTSTANNYGTNIATATGVFIGGIVPQLTNDGTIRALAVARDTETDGSVYASAEAAGIIWDPKTDDPTVSEQLWNTGTVDAHAVATASNLFYDNQAFAGAEAEGVEQQAYGGSSLGGIGFAGVDNSNRISAAATATATGSYAFAVSGARGVAQYVSGTTATAALTNTSAIEVTSRANARAHTYALAVGTADGLVQQAIPGTAASMGLTTVRNTGTLSATTIAHADADTYAYARASANAARQTAEGELSSINTVTNIGSMIGSASAEAFATTYANAGAEAGGVRQYAQALGDVDAGVANNSFYNLAGSHLTVNATAHGSATYLALADASATGNSQYAYQANTIENVIENDGDIAVTATATADAGFFPFVQYGPVVGLANASATGAYQYANGSDGGFDGADGASAKNSYTNNGHLSVTATATANGIGTYAQAAALARATGVDQSVGYAADNQNTVINSGAISVIATAVATGSLEPEAGASAVGVSQDFYGNTNDDVDGIGATSTLTNLAGASITARAVATANTYFETGNEAFAHAVGVRITGESGLTVPLALNFSNQGLIQANATANATYASATAVGVEINGFGAGPNTVTGTFNNAGEIRAYATATGGGAYAAGLFLNTNGTSAELTNTGLIYAYAQGSEAVAEAVVIGSPSGGTIIDETVVHFTNDSGSIFAGISTDGGTTVNRGTAITTRAGGAGDYTHGESLNPVLITLTDDTPAFIYGNILIRDIDTIEATGTPTQPGITYFDGALNTPDNREGSLNVHDYGKFVMVNGSTVFDPANGVSKAFVTNYTNGPTGTTAFQLTPDTTAGSYATTPELGDANYPQIISTNTTLDGTVFVQFKSGLYTGSEYYENVVYSENDISGDYAQIRDNSALLVTSIAHNDGAHDVDIDVDALAFNSPAGLTINQTTVANVLDTLYPDVLLNPDTNFAKLMGYLFTLNTDDYPKGLNMLAGAEFAQQLQSLLWSLDPLNRTVIDRMDCSTNLTGPAPGQCFMPGHFQAWARVGGGFNSNSGDQEAAGYGEAQYNLFFGGDYAITSNLFLGLAAGVFGSHMNFDDWANVGGSTIDYNGYQVAAYGGFDNAKAYLRGIVSYGNYDGTSHRNIGTTGSPVDPTGSPDGSALSAYVEGGLRFNVGPGVLTPFVGGKFAWATLDAFTESDPFGTGAALALSEAKGSSAASVVGARFNADVGKFKTEISLAWQHEFLDTIQTVHSSFVSAPAPNAFDIISSDTARNSALVGLSATYSATANSDVTVKYSGRFSSGYSAHDIMARWTTKF